MALFLRVIEGSAMRYPKMTLAAILAISVVLGYAATTLRVANDPQEFLPNHPLAQASKQIEAEFGAGSFAQTIYVRFVPKPKHTLESAQAILDMERILQALRSIPAIQSATGIPDYVKALRRELHGGKAEYAQLPNPDGTDEFGYSFDELVRLTMQRMNMAKRFLSAQNTAIVTATIRKGADLIEVYLETQAILQSLQVDNSATEFSVYSYGATLHRFNRITRADLMRFLPFVAALALLALGWVFRYTDKMSLVFMSLLWVFVVGFSFKNEPLWAVGFGTGIVLLSLWGFRRLANLFIPLGVVLLAGVWTFGLLAFTGQPLNFLMLAVIPLLLGVGIDYPVYLLYRYEEERQQGFQGPEAMSRALKKVGRSLILTTLTAIAGFSSLIGIDSPPVQAFGMLSNFAVGCSFLITLLAVPAIKRLLNDPQRSADSFAQNYLGNVLARYATWMNRRTAALAVVSLVGLVSLYFFWDGHALKTIAYDPRRLLPDREPLVQLYDRINQEFSTYEEIHILIEGNVTQLVAMRNLIVEIPAQLSASPYTQKLTSIAQYIDDLRNANTSVEKTFEEEFDGTGPNAAYNWILGYIFRRPDLRIEAESLIRSDSGGGYSALLIRVNTLRAPDQASIQAVAQDMTDRLTAVPDRETSVQAQLAKAGLKMTLTGAPFLQTLSLQILQNSLYNSIGISLVLCLGLVIIAFRSIRWGVISLMPVALSAWLVLGTITLIGIELSVSTAMVTSISIGLGVSYAIHWVHRYREECSLPQATARTGEALCGDFLTTLAAFLSLIFGQIVWNRDFGILAAVAICYAFGVTVLVFPALLSLFLPWMPTPKED